MGTGWIEEWVDGDVQVSPMIADWMRNRPSLTQETMLKFPPSCVVRKKGGGPIHCGDLTAIGEIAIVSGYDPEDGDLLLRSDPESGVFHKHPPADLEIVGYFRGLTPAKVRAALTGE